MNGEDDDAEEERTDLKIHKKVKIQTLNLIFRHIQSPQMFFTFFLPKMKKSRESDGPIDFEGADLDIDLNADDLNMEAEMMEVPSPNDD